MPAITTIGSLSAQSLGGVGGTSSLDGVYGSRRRGQRTSFFPPKGTVTVSPAISGASTVDLTTLTLSTCGSWKITPLNNFYANVKMWGAGGGATQAGSQTNGVGFVVAGGGGGYAAANVQFSAGVTYEFTVGCAGGMVNNIRYGGGGGGGTGLEQISTASQTMFAKTNYTSWGLFMNTYAVWYNASDTLFATNNIYETFTATTTGQYSFEIAGDRLTLYVNGTFVASTVDTTTDSPTPVSVTLSAGSHTLRFYVNNGQNIAGFAVRIKNSSNTTVWDTRTNLLGIGYNLGVILVAGGGGGSSWNGEAALIQGGPGGGSSGVAGSAAGTGSGGGRGASQLAAGSGGTGGGSSTYFGYSGIGRNGGHGRNGRPSDVGVVSGMTSGGAGFGKGGFGHNFYTTPGGGGGGGGFFGGGGGSADSSGSYPGAGGGGSGYFNPAYCTSASLTAGSGSNPGNLSDTDRGTAGLGGRGIYAPGSGNPGSGTITQQSTGGRIVITTNPV